MRSFDKICEARGKTTGLFNKVYEIEGLIIDRQEIGATVHYEGLAVEKVEKAAKGCCPSVLIQLEVIVRGKEERGKKKVKKKKIRALCHNSTKAFNT